MSNANDKRYDQGLTTSRSEIDVNIELSRQFWNELHHVESQRSTFTNFMIAIETALVVLIAKSNGAEELPLSFLLTLFGVIGFVATRKYHERYRFAQYRLDIVYRQLSKMSPGSNIFEGLKEAKKRHSANENLMLWGKHLENLPLHVIWSVLHSLFIFTGLVFFIRSVFEFIKHFL